MATAYGILGGNDMIIFGTANKNKTVGQGSFFCPHCSIPAQYTHKAVKQYFSLYFIPLIPMGSGGEFIECDSCGGTFATEVMNYDPEEERRKTVASFRRMAVAFLLDVDRCRARELEVLQDVVGDLGNMDVDPEDIATDVRRAKEANIDLIKSLKKDTAEFADEGKWIVLATFRRILERSGSMMIPEQERLMQVGKAMGLRKKHLETFFNEPLDEPN